MSETSPNEVLPWSELIERLDTYGIFLTDTSNRITSWNAGIEAMFGYRADEFVGRSGEILFTPEDRANGAPEREIRAAVRNGSAQDNRWHLRRDGSRLWVNGAMNALFDDAGNLVGFLKILRDQTEMREAQERLRESEARFQKAFHGSPSPVVVVTAPDLTVVDVNEAFERAFGRTPDEARGRALADVGAQPRPDQLEAVRAALAQGRTVREELAFVRADGDVGHGVFAFEPVDLGGEPHAVVLVHDVTEWRRAQDQIEEERRFVTATLASLPGVFYMLDGYRYIRWNDDLERVSGYTAEELGALRPEDLVLEGEAVLEQIDRAFHAGRASMEGHLRTKDGTLVPYLFTGQRVLLGGRPYVVGVGVDIREQRRSRRMLERRAREQGAIAELAAATLQAEDVQQALDLATRLLAETLQAERVHVLERGDEGGDVVVRAVHEAAVHADEDGETGRGAADDLSTSLAAGRWRALDDALGEDSRCWNASELSELGMRSGICARIRGAKRPFGLIEALSPRENAFGADDERYLRSVAALLAGALEQARLHAELAHKADHDVLTGLPNRSVFEARLNDAVERARRARTRVAVLFLDLDRFKNINDSLGHQVGDEILKSVAGRVQEAVRSWDTVARIGGDEFVLFLPDVDHEAEIAHVTNRLLAAFDAPVAAGGRDTTVRTTIGIAVFPEDAEDVAGLLRAADTAMYEGKAKGRSTFHFFTKEQNEMVAERLTLEAELRHALERDELEIRYQPMLSVADGRVDAVEALVRWRHPRRGRLGPDAFIPVAEAIGLAVPIGEWTLREALRRHAAWREEAPSPPRIAVNVAAPHFVQPTFPATVEALLREEGVAPEEVELEITEDALHDHPLAAGHIAALARVGVRVVLDDFGSGLSSVARLRDLAIRRVKIDELFTHRVDEPRGRALVEAMVRLAASLGMGTVAEGIETEAQYEAVRELGFDVVQGHLFSTPRDAVPMRAYLRGSGPTGVE